MNLGRLERIELREIWSTEDKHFTPWLAGEANIALLGETLGFDLEVEAQEKEVGPFRADILCKDTADDSWVLVENQLERTDHKHLGQLLTYASGLQAATIIWVAAKFTDEHRSTLDWLNQITDEKFRFFGLEVELWRIGDSIAAPKFNVISQPNEWSRSVGNAAKRIEHGELSPTRLMQQAFWTELCAALATRGTWKSRKPQPQAWMSFSIGRSGMHLGTLTNTRDNWIGVELYLAGDDCDAHFHLLASDKEAIENELGLDIEWRELPNSRSCKIIYKRTNAPLSEEKSWPEYINWMVATLEKFDRVFRPRVRELRAEDFDRRIGEDAE